MDLARFNTLIDFKTGIISQHNQTLGKINPSRIQLPLFLYRYSTTIGTRTSVGAIHISCFNCLNMCLSLF